MHGAASAAVNRICGGRPRAHDLFLLFVRSDRAPISRRTPRGILPAGQATSGTAGWASSTRRSAACRAAGLLNRHVVFGGKGGGWQTTCSSAFALAASRQRQRCCWSRPTRPIPPRTSRAEDRAARCANRSRDCRRSKSTAGEATRVTSTTSSGHQRMFSLAIIQQAHRQIELAAASRPAGSGAARSHDRSHVAPSGPTISRVRWRRPASAAVAADA